MSSVSPCEPIMTTFRFALGGETIVIVDRYGEVHDSEAASSAPGPDKGQVFIDGGTSRSSPSPARSRCGRNMVMVFQGVPVRFDEACTRTSQAYPLSRAHEHERGRDRGARAGEARVRRFRSRQGDRSAPFGSEVAACASASAFARGMANNPKIMLYARANVWFVIAHHWHDHQPHHQASTRAGSDERGGTYGSAFRMASRIAVLYYRRSVFSARRKKCLGATRVFA